MLRVPKSTVSSPFIMIFATGLRAGMFSSSAAQKHVRQQAATHLRHMRKARLGVALGDRTADGRVSLEPVYCLGLCSVSPSAMLDGKVVGRLDEKKLDSLIARADR